MELTTFILYQIFCVKRWQSVSGSHRVGFLSGPPPSGVDFQVPSDSLADAAWILLLQRVYADPTDSGRKQ
jgi:hypothetical protein